MATEPTYSSRTYGFSVQAPEALNDPISSALTKAVPVSPPRQRQQAAITANSAASAAAGGEEGNNNQQQNNQVALVPPTKTIELIGGRSRFVDDEDVDMIVDTWLDEEKDPSDVKLIDLSLNKISSKGILNLVKAIGQRPGQLKDLDIDSNSLKDEALKGIIEHIINNDKVQVERLDLSTNDFTDLAVCDFIKAIQARKQNTPLRTLLLRQCNLTNTALRVICDYLADPDCTLTSLHISGNDFTELDGIKWVAEAIKKNKTLLDFNVSNCFDYVARWEPICDALEENEYLQKFNIAVMGKKAEGIAAMDQKLTANRRAALARFSEVERVKMAHAKEIEALNAQFKLREQKLESRIVELMKELERYRN